MQILKSVKITLVAACVILAVAACGRSDDEPSKRSAPSKALLDGGGILTYVPADSPYVLAGVEVLPEDVREKMEPYIGAMLTMYREVARDALAASTSRAVEEEGLDPEAASETEAAAGRLLEFLSVEGLRDAGIDVNAGLRAAIYGVGLLPVLRIELTDEGDFEKFLAKLEEEAGEPMPAGSVGGQPYRHIGDEDAQAIIATIDGHLVAALAPGEVSEDLLKRLLGLTPPQQSIAAAGGLDALAREYDFSPYLLGYFDFERIAATFLDPQEGVNADLLSLMEYDSTALSDVCRREIRELAGVMPRIVVGYDEVSTERMTGNMVAELRPDIATGLKALAAPVPGLGTDHGGLFSFGLGVDLLAARAFYASRLDAIESDPFECEFFADFQAGVAAGRQALEAPIPPIVYSVKGFTAVVDDIKGMDMASKQPPTDIDMRLLIATDNAYGLIALGGIFSPELAELELEPDGKPVEISLPPMGQPFTTAQIAMTDNALGIAVGNGAETRLGELIGASVGDSNPFMSWQMDTATYYTFMGEVMAQAAAADESDNQLSPQAAAAMKKGLTEMGKLFERMSFEVTFTDRGIEMPYEATLSD